MSDTTTIQIKRSDANYLKKLKKTHGLVSLEVVMSKVVNMMRRLKLDGEIIKKD